MFRSDYVKINVGLRMHGLEYYAFNLDQRFSQRFSQRFRVAAAAKIKIPTMYLKSPI